MCLCCTSIIASIITVILLQHETQVRKHIIASWALTFLTLDVPDSHRCPYNDSAPLTYCSRLLGWLILFYYAARDGTLFGCAFRTTRKPKIALLLTWNALNAD